MRPAEQPPLRATLAHLKQVAASGNGGLVDSQVLADFLWIKLRQEAEEALAKTPVLAPLFVDSMLNRASFEAAKIAEGFLHIPDQSLTDSFNVSI